MDRGDDLRLVERRRAGVDVASESIFAMCVYAHEL